MCIFREKNFRFSEDFRPDKIPGYAIEDSFNWESTKKSLHKIRIDKETEFGIIFCSAKLEKYYNELKNYFVKQNNISTQHVITRKLLDQRRGRTMKYNLVDQINVKQGGQNYYIKFLEEKIFKEKQVFLVIGLDSKRNNHFITYSMVSSKNFELNKFYTQEKTCLDKNDPRNNTLKTMFKEAIKQLIKVAPQNPDYIILYRQGGNDIQNKILAINELDNFLQVLNDFREEYKNKDDLHNFKNSKFYYICCNLKSDLKFFEVHKNEQNNKTEYKNPVSGLVVDEKVTQPNKYEFYIQPQYVNQGTATPCHYQVMYYDKGQKEEDNLEIEKLEKLSYDLSFYYWTWSGAIRVPSLLKMSSVAMDFCRKVYKDEACSFENPIFI
jgi:aubergine-like protein